MQHVKTFRLVKFLSRSMSTIGIKTKPPIAIFGVEGKYVSALYSAAVEKSELEKVESDLQGILKMLAKPGIQDFFDTSFMSAKEKSKLMLDAGKDAGLAECTTNFLALVAENNRFKLLRRMITMFGQVMTAHRKEVMCEVITAKPLDDGTRSKLMASLKKIVQDKEITLIEKVEPNIIGGMIVGIQDKHIDLSIARKIQMYTEIIQRSV